MHNDRFCRNINSTQKETMDNKVSIIGTHHLQEEKKLINSLF